MSVSEMAAVTAIISGIGLLGSAVSMLLATAGIALMVLAVYRAAGPGAAGTGPGAGSSMGFVADRPYDEVLAHSPLRAGPSNGPQWDPPAGYARPDAG